MSRMRDILLRFKILFAPFLLPIIYVVDIGVILYDNFKNTTKEMWEYFLEALKDFTSISFIKSWFGLLYYVLFDWEINSVNKPRIAKLEQKIKEMKEKDFEK